MNIKEQYIKKAVEALTTGNQPIVSNEKYNKVFKGYISGLGASIIQMGLLPSIIFYENSPSSQEDKSKVIETIKYMLIELFQYTELNDTQFSEFIKNYQNKRKLLLDVNKVLIAIKSALRMFKYEEE